MDNLSEKEVEENVHTVGKLKPLLLLFIEANSPAPSLLIAAFPDYPDAIIRATFSALLDSEEIFFTEDRRLSTKTKNAPVEVPFEPVPQVLSHEEMVKKAVLILKDLPELSETEEILLHLFTGSNLQHGRINE